MQDLERRRNRGSATSDFIVFFTVSTLFFVIGSMTLVPWVYEVEPFWLLQRWDASADLASRLFGAERPSAAPGSTAEGAVSEMPGSETYTVRPGDTLSEIARTHAVAMGELVALNGIEEPDILNVGRVLLIRETRRGATEPPQRQAASLLGAEREPEASRAGDGHPAGLTDVLQRATMALQRLARGSRSAASLWRWDSGGESAAVLPGAPPSRMSVDVATASAPPRDFAAVDELVAVAEEQLRSARFEEALETAGEAIRLLESDAGSSGANSRRVPLELMRAEAHLAFGDSEAARRSLERALDADPELTLDPDRTSPKVLSSFDRVRLQRQPSPGASQSGR